MIKRSCQCTDCIGYYKAQINEIRPELTWNDCFIIGVQTGETLTHDELKEKLQKLKRQKRSIPADVKHPSAVQVSLDPSYANDVMGFENKAKEALELTRLQSGFEFELLLLIVLEKLTSEAMLVGETKESKKPDDLTGPDMVKLLVQMLMYDREKDKPIIEEIKRALLRWEV